MGSCLRTNDTLMQRGMQACCRCRNALSGQAMMRESAGRRGRCRAASAVYRRVLPSEVARKKTPRPLGDLRASFDTCNGAKGTRKARGCWGFPCALGRFQRISPVCPKETPLERVDEQTGKIWRLDRQSAAQLPYPAARGGRCRAD